MVCIGATFVDIKGYPSGVFIPDGRNAGKVETMHGGVCCNVSRDAARLGRNVKFVSLVNDSGTGREVIEDLQRENVNTRYIRMCKNGMGTWLAVFDESGNLFASISQRPDLTKIEHILKEVGDEIFTDERNVMFEIDMDDIIVSRIFSLAEKHHMKVYSCVSNMTAAKERIDYIRKTDLFVCNEQEAGILFECCFEHLTAEEAQKSLLACIKKAGIRCMVMTCGAEGAVYATSAGLTGFVPAMATCVKDTTGAGDAFFAGVCAALDSGMTLDNACLVGAKAAAMVVEREENICLPMDIEQLKEQ